VNETIITQSGLGCFIECFVVRNFFTAMSSKTRKLCKKLGHFDNCLLSLWHSIMQCCCMQFQFLMKVFKCKFMTLISVL